MEPNEALRKARDMDRGELDSWYEKNVGYNPSEDDQNLPLFNLQLLVAEMMFYHSNEGDQDANEARWKEETGGWVRGR